MKAILIHITRIECDGHVYESERKELVEIDRLIVNGATVEFDYTRKRGSSGWIPGMREVAPPVSAAAK